MLEVEQLLQRTVPPEIDRSLWRFEKREGLEARRWGAALLDEHLRQRFPQWDNLSFTPPSPTIRQAITYRMTQPAEYPLDLGRGDSVILPITLTEQTHVLRDDTDRLFIFADHAESLEPSDALYQTISNYCATAQRRIDPSVMFRWVLMNLVTGGSDRDAFARYIAGHQEVAARNDIALDEEKLLRYWDQKLFTRVPMHCYGAGIGGAGKDPEAAARFLNEAVRQLFRRSAELSAEQIESDWRAQLVTADDMAQSLRYDVLPFADKAAFDTQIEIAAALLQNRFGAGKADPFGDLPDVPAEIANPYVLAVCLRAGTMASDRLLITRTTETEIEQMLETGALALRQSLNLTAERITAILDATPTLQQTAMRKHLPPAVRLLESIRPHEQPADGVSRDALHWMKLTEQRSFLDETINSWKRRDTSSPSRLFGIIPENRQVTLTPKDSPFPPVPMMEYLVEYDSGQKHLTDVPLWRYFLDRRTSLPFGLRWDELETHVRETAALFHHPLWERQATSDQRQQVHAFFDWLTFHLAAFRNGPKEYVAKETRESLDAVKYNLLSEYYSPLRDALEDWVDQSWLAMQMQQMQRNITALGYPSAVSANRRPAGQTAKADVFLSDNYHPYHLVAHDAARYQEQLNKLREGMRHIEGKDRSGNFQHLGERLYLLHGTGLPVSCRDYRFNRKTKKTEQIDWNFRAASHAALLDWHPGPLPPLPESASSFIAYREREERKIEAGRSLTYWAAEAASRLLAAQAAAVPRKEQIPLQREALRRLETLYDVYMAADVGSYSCGQGFFDYVLSAHEHVAAMLSIAEDNRIIPPGELHIPPGTMVYLLGENMAGKSSFMRGLTYGAVLENHGFPQPGEAQFPHGLRIDTAVGNEQQESGVSLLSNMIPGLNRLAAGTADMQTLWAMDELGRRTSKHYGEALALAASIFALKANTPDGVAAAASHYHDLPALTPLLHELGIKTAVYVVDNYRLRPLSAGEKTRSHAIAALARYVSPEALELWPDASALDEVIRQPASTEFPTYSIQKINDGTFQDLLGRPRDQEKLIAMFAKDADDVVLRKFFELFDDPAAGPRVQSLIESCKTDNLTEEYAQTRQLYEIVAFYAAEKRNADYHEGKIRMYEQVFSLSWDEAGGKFFPLVREKITRLSAGCMLTLDRLKARCDTTGIPIADISGLQRILAGVDRENGDLPLERECRTLRRELAGIIGLLAYTDYVNQPGAQFCRAVFTDEAVVSIRDVWNPLLDEPIGQQVRNDLRIDFTQQKAGTFIKGENYSGKSNLLRAGGLAGWLALCTGYGPAREIRINPKTRFLSLTQPVADAIGKSSMQAEAQLRISPAVAALSLAEMQDRYLVTLLDEPGAPTSPEDAGRMITWLYGHYHAALGRAVLVIPSHCDQVPEELRRRNIPVDYLAFRLLSEHPFKAFPGTADSNALSVARHLGLSARFADVAAQCYQYIQAVDAGADAQETARSYASEIKTILARPEPTGNNPPHPAAGIIQKGQTFPGKV